MKYTTSSILAGCFILSNAAALPSSGKPYHFKLKSENPELKDGVLTLKSGSPGNTPNALGIFSSGEPHTEYTFTFATSSASSKAYEIKGSVGGTHLIVSGNSIAMNMLDVPIGADPKIGTNEKQLTERWLVREEQGKSMLGLAEGLEGSMQGAGSWRSCKGNSERDYELYWFDGLHALQEVVKGCESVGIYIEEVKASASSCSSITGVPAPTATSTGFITGVPAPASTQSGFITGVPAPSDTYSGFITGVPAPSDTHSGFITGVPAPSDTRSGFITGVPAPSDTYSGFITGVPAPSDTHSGFITGVPAPSGTQSRFITGVPAPSGTGTFIPGISGRNTTGTGATPKPSSFEGAGSRVAVAGTIMAAGLGAVACLL